MYRVAFDFRVTRRVDWASDPAAFHGHVEDVCRHIASHRRVRDVMAITDLAASCLTLEFDVDADDDEMAASDAVGFASDAIDRAGARRLEVHSPAPDRSVESEIVSDLLTPVWRQRRILIAEAA